MDPLEFAIEQATMAIFAQAEQRRRLAKKNEVVYTRRERDQEIAARKARIADQKFNEVRTSFFACQLSACVGFTNERLWMESLSCVCPTLNDVCRRGMRLVTTVSTTGVTLRIWGVPKRNDGSVSKCGPLRSLPRQSRTPKVHFATNCIHVLLCPLPFDNPTAVRLAVPHADSGGYLAHAQVPPNIWSPRTKPTKRSGVDLTTRSLCPATPPTPHHQTAQPSRAEPSDGQQCQWQANPNQSKSRPGEARRGAASQSSIGRRFPLSEHDNVAKRGQISRGGKWSLGIFN